MLLFVREKPKDERGRSLGFVYLGPVRLVDHRGERPIQITWRLDEPMPEKWFRLARAAAV